MNFDHILFILWTSRGMPICVVLNAVGDDTEVEFIAAFCLNASSQVQPYQNFKAY